MSNDSPLSNPENWSKPKTWIVPVEITIMVDDPSQYDSQMQSFVDRVLNELRSICTNFDKRMLRVSFREPIKEVSQFDNAVKSVKTNDTIKELNIQELIQQEIAKQFGKK